MTYFDVTRYTLTLKRFLLLTMMFRHCAKAQICCVTMIEIQQDNFCQLKTFPKAVHRFNIVHNSFSNILRLHKESVAMNQGRNLVCFDQNTLYFETEACLVNHSVLFYMLKTFSLY